MDLRTKRQQTPDGFLIRAAMSRFVRVYRDTRRGISVRRSPCRNNDASGKRAVRYQTAVANNVRVAGFSPLEPTAATAGFAQLNALCHHDALARRANGRTGTNCNRGGAYEGTRHQRQPPRRRQQ